MRSTHSIQIFLMAHTRVICERVSIRLFQTSHHISDLSLMRPLFSLLPESFEPTVSGMRIQRHHRRPYAAVFHDKQTANGTSSRRGYSVPNNSWVLAVKNHSCSSLHGYKLVMRSPKLLLL